MDSGRKVEGGFNCERAFKNKIKKDDIIKAHAIADRLWGDDIIVIDPMAGGGSIPLESAQMGFNTLANEYNPVACSVLEATVDYPIRFGKDLSDKTRKWANLWLKNSETRLAKFYPKRPNGMVHAYIYARTVPCPDTQFQTPLVPDWHLCKPKDSPDRVWAEPIVDKQSGTWTVRIVDNRTARRGIEPPKATYSRGKGISLFSERSQIPPEYIKAKAQAGEMRSALYAVVLKTQRGFEYVLPEVDDYKALKEADAELARLRPGWEASNIIPTELYPDVSTDERPRLYGMPRWSDMFLPRQLLSACILVEELQKLRPEVLINEGNEAGEAIVHLLSFIFDKFINYNSILCSWHAPRLVIRSVFDRHDFAFKATSAELATCTAGIGFSWAIGNVMESFEEICKIVNGPDAKPVPITMGSASSLPYIADRSITAVVMDPPYADNVQYSELADYFYVWLKRTQGYRHPEWFSTYLCEHREESVVNPARYRMPGVTAKVAKQQADVFYQKMMTDTFREAYRILRDEGVLTVMFTHKKQEAWEALFTSLIKSGFTITASWPVKTESEHSLHQAKKNAAESTVILVARKRPLNAEVGWFDVEMKQAIRMAAQKTAQRLQEEGLNPIDQLLGSFGPAMEVYSRYGEVRTDTGETVGVKHAIDEASEAVTELRIRQLSERGLEGIEPEGLFYLLCWDVLQAAEFRFNEAKLLGHVVGMDVDSLVASGLVLKAGDKIKILSAKERRRSEKLEVEEAGEVLFGALPTGKMRHVSKADVLKVHPNDPHFRTALDGCHALALRYIEAGGGNPGIGSARQLAIQQVWKGGSAVAKLMEALVKAAPPALRFDHGPNSAGAMYPEFRAWHELLLPLFGVKSPEWKEDLQSDLANFGVDETDTSDVEEEEDQE